MKDVLEETHGVMVYQEQVMRILNRLGGIELANAYTCIKAISKKKLEMIAKYPRAVRRRRHGQGPGPKRRPANCSSMIEKFAGYGFNKSHSTAYALIAYMTAYLKAHYPVEFMAALLSGDIAGPQLQEEGLAGRASGRLPADGHRGRAAGREPLATPISPWPTARSASACRAIKGCGGAAADGDRRPRARPADRSATCSISASGVDPGAGQPRGDRNADQGRRVRFARRARARSTWPSIERAMQAGAAAARRSPQRPEGPVRRDRRGRASRQPASASLPDVPEWDERERLANEKEVLGFYLTSHPLAEHEKTLATYCSHTTADVGRRCRTAPK